MTKRYALLRDDRVDAVILSDETKLPRLIAATELKLAQLKAAIDVTDSDVSAGDRYDAETRTFSRPEPPSSEPTPTPEERIDKLERELAALKAKG